MLRLKTNGCLLNSRVPLPFPSTSQFVEKNSTSKALNVCCTLNPGTSQSHRHPRGSPPPPPPPPCQVPGAVACGKGIAIAELLQQFLEGKQRNLHDRKVGGGAGSCKGTGIALVLRSTHRQFRLG